MTMLAEVPVHKLVNTPALQHIIQKSSGFTSQNKNKSSRPEVPLRNWNSAFCWITMHAKVLAHNF